MLPRETDGEGSRYKKVTKKCRNLPRQRALESSSKWVWTWRRGTMPGRGRKTAERSGRKQWGTWPKKLGREQKAEGGKKWEQRGNGSRRCTRAADRNDLPGLKSSSIHLHKYLHSVFNSAVWVTEPKIFTICLLRKRFAHLEQDVSWRWWRTIEEYVFGMSLANITAVIDGWGGCSGEKWVSALGWW